MTGLAVVILHVVDNFRVSLISRRGAENLCVPRFFRSGRSGFVLRRHGSDLEASRGIGGDGPRFVKDRIAVEVLALGKHLFPSVTVVVELFVRLDRRNEKQ